MEASVATPGQGAPAAGAQPPAGGQGQPQGTPTAAGKGDAGASFNWEVFPSVPVEQRELLEPHLRNVQGHVTKLEQQYAPYKGLTDMVGPDQVENLVGFLNAYNGDPVATVLGLVQDIQSQGALTPEHMQALQAIAGQQGTPTPGQEAQPGQEEVPPWAQQIMQRFDQYDQQQQAQQAAQAEAEGEQILDQAKTNIRGQLTQGGITEDLVSDEQIVAFIIANDGDEQAAVNQINQMRQSFLGAFTNDKTGGARPPSVQGELPQPPKSSGRPDRDGFGGDVKNAALQRLQQVAAANATGG